MSKGTLAFRDEYLDYLKNLKLNSVNNIYLSGLNNTTLSGLLSYGIVLFGYNPDIPSGFLLKFDMICYKAGTIYSAGKTPSNMISKSVFDIDGKPLFTCQFKLTRMYIKYIIILPFLIIVVYLADSMNHKKWQNDYVFNVHTDSWKSIFSSRWP